VSNSSFNPHSFTAGSASLIATGAMALVGGLARAAAQVQNEAHARIIEDGIQHLADRGNELVEAVESLRIENALLQDENARLEAALTTATLQLAGVGRDLVRYFRARGLT
jgi:hypothetical protein